MSQYFDHVRCSSCGTSFDPEQIGGGVRQLSCPHCGAMLQVADLFGLKDQWLEEEEEHLTLEDAVPGHKREEGPEEGSDAEPAHGDLPARPVDTRPLGALDILRQMKKDE
jgi:hypothetical protein